MVVVVGCSLGELIPVELPEFVAAVLVAKRPWSDVREARLFESVVLKFTEVVIGDVVTRLLEVTGLAFRE